MKTASPFPRRLVLAVAGLLATLAPVLAGWAIFRARSAPVRLSGESVTTTPDFSLRASRYALQADLLPGQGCQIRCNMDCGGSRLSSDDLVAGRGDAFAYRVEIAPRAADDVDVDDTAASLSATTAHSTRDLLVVGRDPH